MTSKNAQGEQLRKAIKYVSDKLSEDSGIDLTKLVDDACLRYDLNPKDSEFLIRFVKKSEQLSD